MRIGRLITLIVLAFSMSGPVQAVHPADEALATKWFGPQEIDAQQAGIGKRIPDFTLEQLYGAPISLHGSGGAQGTVIFVRDPECPVSRAYGPRLAQFARTYHEAGFSFLALYMNDQIGDTALAADASGFDGPALFVKGGVNELAKQLGVESTGDVFILDDGQRLVYRGAVDDQYGLGYTREFPTNKLLERALDAVREGKPVAVPATNAPGCYIDTDPYTAPELEPWTPDEQQV